MAEPQEKKAEGGKEGANQNPGPSDMGSMTNNLPSRMEFAFSVFFFSLDQKAEKNY